MHALALGQHAGLVARRAQQHVKPFVAREVLALLDHGLQVKVRHLDGREAGHRKRRVLRPALLSDGALLGPLVAEHFHAEIVFVKVHPAVFNAHDAPNAPLQDLGVVAHVIGRHHERLDVQVREMRLVDVLVLVKHGRHLVDDGVLPQLADLRLDALAFVGAHVVVREDGANAVKAGRQVFLVVGGAIHPQQVFQHERGHVRPALHERRQVLAHDFAAEVLQQLAVKLVSLKAHGPGGARHSLPHGHREILVELCRVAGVRNRVAGVRNRAAGARRRNAGIGAGRVLPRAARHGLLVFLGRLNCGNLPQIVIVSSRHGPPFLSSAPCARTQSQAARTKPLCDKARATRSARFGARAPPADTPLSPKSSSPSA